MKKFIILFLILPVMALWGLEYKPGSGINPLLPERDNTAFYHNGEDSRHFYYSYPEASDHRWAVLFDFEIYYDDLDSLSFVPQSVHIYLPNPTTSGNLTAGLYQAGNIGPGELITENFLQTAEINAGWNQIELATAADTLFWLVVDYPTGLGNQQYISASNGDGTHSYYWDPYYGSEGTWRNMSANGFNNEFLFSLEGEFIFGSADLEILSFELEGDFEPQNEIIPRVVLHNNYTLAADSITVIFKKEFPGFLENDTLFVEELAGGESLELPQQGEISYVLSEQPGQYKFTVTLYCEDDEIFANNSIIIEMNTYNIDNQQILIENMVELDDNYTNGIWSAQAAVSGYELLPVNYFPSYQDEIYYNNLAEERYHYYELYNLPATVVAGEPHIGYLESAYQTELAEMLAQYTASSSFVQIYSIEALVDTLEDVHVTVTLDRGANQILPGFSASCHLFGMIYESDLPLNSTTLGNVFIDTLQFASPSLSGLANSPVKEMHTVFSKIYDYTPLEDSLNCHLLFWVQNIDDNKIWAVGELPFTDFGIVAAAEDEIAPLPRVYAYPNPYNCEGNMQIIMPEQWQRTSTEISIYNIRGQLVKRLNSGITRWNGLDENEALVGTGIYFIQINGQRATEWLKVMVIK